MEPSPRESIFVSAMRTFCRVLFGLVAFFLVTFIYAKLFSSSPLIEEKTTLSLLPDANGKNDLLPVSTPAILQISIHGVIGDPKKIDTELMSHVLIDSRKGMLSHDRVKGILLHFNTPGGTVVDSENIYRMLNEYKKRYQVPVIGYVDGLCASGGMYIASATDQMFAGPAAIIGSVGVVIGPFFNFYDLMNKWGVQARTLYEGLDKDMLNPTRPWKPGEDASIKAVISFSYQRFVDVVTQSRPRLDRTKLVTEYGAQIYDCVTAMQLGYIDHAMTSRDDALRALLSASHIDADKPYQVVALTPKNPWFGDLVSGKSPLLSGQIEHTLDGLPAKIRQQPCYLYTYE